MSLNISLYSQQKIYIVVFVYQCNYMKRYILVSFVNNLYLYINRKIKKLTKRLTLKSVFKFLKAQL